MNFLIKINIMAASGYGPKRARYERILPNDLGRLDECGLLFLGRKVAGAVYRRVDLLNSNNRTNNTLSR